MAISFGVPTEQFRTSYTLLVPSQYNTNFFAIAAHAGDAVTLDGADISSQLATFGSSAAFAAAIVPVLMIQRFQQWGLPLEGMILAAYAVGASRGYVYVRLEYSLANSVMREEAFTAITPKAVASSMGTSMQATVHCAPFSTWSSSISE